MSESKIYMFPDNQQNNAAMWAALSNKDQMLPLATMMNGGMNGMWNNPLIIC